MSTNVVTLGAAAAWLRHAATLYCAHSLCKHSIQRAHVHQWHALVTSGTDDAATGDRSDNQNDRTYSMMVELCSYGGNPT